MQIQFRCVVIISTYILPLLARRARCSNNHPLLLSLYLPSQPSFFYFSQRTHQQPRRHRVILCTYAIMQIMRCSRFVFKAITAASAS
jgi:hypothetical protein